MKKKNMHAGNDCIFLKSACSLIVGDWRSGDGRKWRVPSCDHCSCRRASSESLRTLSQSTNTFSLEAKESHQTDREGEPNTNPGNLSTDQNHPLDD